MFWHYQGFRVPKEWELRQVEKVVKFSFEREAVALSGVQSLRIATVVEVLGQF